MFFLCIGVYVYMYVHVYVYVYEKNLSLWFNKQYSERLVHVVHVPCSVEVYTQKALLILISLGTD